MKPKEKKYLIMKALTDSYGFNQIITRKQIHEVHSSAPQIFPNCLLVERELCIARGEYKTPKNLSKYEGFMVPTLKKQKTVKEVLNILSSDNDVDNEDYSCYNDYINEDEDISEILRML